VGETLTAVPLEAVRFPGVMTPVPLAKIPVRLADPPAVIFAGLAAKLVMAGSAGKDPPLNELNPVRKTRKTTKAEAHKKYLVTRFKVPPVTNATEGTSVFQENPAIRSIT
jgi:hypothetical protein